MALMHFWIHFRKTFYVDSQLTLNTSTPALTECFLNTVFVWVPCSFLFLASPCLLWKLRTCTNKSINHNWINVTKTIVGLALILWCIVDIVIKVDTNVDRRPIYLTHIFAAVYHFFAMTVAVMLIQIIRTRGVYSSGVLFIYWMLQFLTAIVSFSSRISAVSQGRSSQYAVISTGVFAFLVLVEILLSCFSETRLEGLQDRDKYSEYPEETSPFLSVITFWWFTRLLINGYSRTLVEEDVWLVNKDNQARLVTDKFEQYWKTELPGTERCRSRSITVSSRVSPLQDTPVSHKQTRDHHGRLLTSFAKAFGGPYLAAGLLKFCHDLLVFVSPFLLKLLIGFIENKNEHQWKGYLYAVLMLVIDFLKSIILHQYFHRCFLVGMRLKTATTSAVYRKVLKLSSSARNATTIGEVVNLMSVDAQRLLELTTCLHMIWSGPLQMLLAFIFLWTLLGPSVLAGIGVLAILIPISTLISQKRKTLQEAQMTHKDARIKLVNEVLNGIRVIKCNGWELSFQQKILEIRKKEMAVVKKTAFLHAAISFLWTSSPFFMSLSSFGVYMLVSPENVLDAEKAFVSLSLFMLLRFPLSTLAKLFGGLVQAHVALKRIRQFLASEELISNDVTRSDNTVGASIVIKDGTFSWDKCDTAPCLNKINLMVEKVKLTVVLGSLGSGKSSLLSAILGNMEKLEGSVLVKGTTAYVAEAAWIQNATVQDNILFGRPMIQERYDKVIEACALKTDLDMFTAGDLTEVGGKGVNLSGGQKQRLTLARAVYADADVYLLDNPLSAVDAQVGKHIFEKVFSSEQGLLKNKTRLMVSHGLRALLSADYIIELLDGKISKVGTLEELQKDEQDFGSLLRYYYENDETYSEDLLSSSDVIIPDILSTASSTSSISGLASNTYEYGERLHNVKSGSGLSSELPVSGYQRRSSLPYYKTPSLVYKRRGSAAISESKLVLHSCRRSHSRVSRSSYKQTHLSSFSLNLTKSPHLMHMSQRSLCLSESASPTYLRQISLSQYQDVDTNVVGMSKLISEETSPTGRVKLSVFTSYARPMGCLIIGTILLLYILHNGVIVYSNMWLSEWSDEKPVNGTGNNISREVRIGVYGTLVIFQGIVLYFAAFTLANGAIMVSTSLHGQLLASCMRAPIDFYDTTPVGRIMNRFSWDIDVMDIQIPRNLESWLKCVFLLLGTIFVISYTTPIFMVVLVPLAILYYFIQRFYVATSSQIKRWESISRSPIYSHLEETIQGVFTIRAYDQQQRFVKECDKRIDDNLLWFYPIIVAKRWLALRLEFIGHSVVFFSALFAVIGRDYLSAGLVGLSVGYALNITQVLNMLARNTSEVETNVVAVERIKEYTELPEEAAWHIDSTTPRLGWPDKGNIMFDNLSVRYRDGLDPVLNCVTCHFKPGEKIGIVGRTGAGKSSMALSLLRILEPENGRILIDGIDIKDIGLHDLRSSLTIIPQDPILFSGSLMTNLDPLGTHSDDEIWMAIEHAHLKEFVISMGRGLEFECIEGGINLSLGQRQLVCFARALLHKTKVFILDEATAAVDLETECLIQSSILQNCGECTIVNIAHRLNTVMDHSRVIVLSAGRIAEFDTPENLLQQKGIFYQMAKDDGITDDGFDGVFL